MQGYVLTRKVILLQPTTELIKTNRLITSRNMYMVAAMAIASHPAYWTKIFQIKQFLVSVHLVVVFSVNVFFCVLNWLKLVSWHSCYDNVSVPLFLRDYLSVQRTNPSDLVLLGILWNEKLRLSDCCNTTILFLLVQINFLECIIVRLHMLQALSTEASRCWDTRYTCVIPCSISFALLCVNVLQCSKVVHRPAMWDGFAS